ncbi:SEP-domain-containing protein [Clavulina sp. PMI_390]|nr:SEP-domain-containing protein [Clavulina sp. PMI_390]
MPQRRGNPGRGGDDGDSDGDDGQGENWFTGGERSGLSVENPNRPSGPRGIVRDILRKAADGGSRAPEPAPPTGGGGWNAFSGGGNTLGSDDVASRRVPDPSAAAAAAARRSRPVPGAMADDDDEDYGGEDDEEQETASRMLTFWKDGFSVEDGPLMKYDDPENQKILDALNNGNAPPSILNVRVGQPVELRVAKRTDENYVAPPKKLQLFGGSGNRLGSPAPAVTSSAPAPSSSAMPGGFPGATSTAPTTFDEASVQSVRPRFEVDMDQPNTSVQIRLADGTRLVSRMNLTHTVGDIRNFINASRPASEQRAYTIGTTFPNKTLDDDSVTIEAGKLQNSVIVQRWA